MSVNMQASIVGNTTFPSFKELNSTESNWITSINYYGLIYTSLLFVIGIPGNVLVFFVYSKKTRKNSTTIFILVLAVFDLVNCTATLPTEIVMLLNPFVFNIGPVCKMSRFTTYTCNSAAAVILAAIAVDRYKRVCTPHGKQITLKRAKRMALWAFITSVSFTWPSLMIYGQRTISTESANVTRQICEIDDSHVLTVYPLIYYSYMCFSTCGIYFILLASYISIVMKMVKRRNFTSLIGRRSVSNKEVPDIHIEHPSSIGHHTNALQVTSVHSSTRSLNVCCRTDESNCFQYEPAVSVPKNSQNMADTSKVKDHPNEMDLKLQECLMKPDENKIKPNCFLNVDGLMDCKEVVNEYGAVHGEKYNNQNEQNVGSNPENNSECIESKNNENDKTMIRVLNNLNKETDESNQKPKQTMTKTNSLDVPSPKHSPEISSNDSSKYENTSENRNKTKRKRKVSQTRSNTGEISLNGSSKSKMRPSKRSLRAHRLGKTTLMLLVVTMVYILSFLPFLGVVIQRSISPIVPLLYKGEYDTVYEALYRSYLLNCAVNPLIYSFCNANFRKDCQATCRRRKLFYR
ncbi:D(2) dopamine receptor A-like [Mytilus edulis]|uniref:D(2) dopamine receptor A-like n=1 Tax=Mytilus edulis TaxID=6550 RepID=UPI0039EF03C3